MKIRRKFFFLKKRMLFLLSSPKRIYNLLSTNHSQSVRILYLDYLQFCGRLCFDRKCTDWGRSLKSVQYKGGLRITLEDHHILKFQLKKKYYPQMREISYLTDKTFNYWCFEDMVSRGIFAFSRGICGLVYQTLSGGLLISSPYAFP